MPDSNLPIDIQCRKLLDWLVSRRVCSRDWHKTVLTIREKIGGALQDMPEHPAVRDLLSGSDYGINYFHCLEIVEILKETEASTKNFFGGYSSQRMSDWKSVVSSYQRDQVYIAEAAQLLIQSVAYDVPALKKQIQKCYQTQEECDKKVTSNDKKIEEFKQEFERGCAGLGVSSDQRETINKTTISIKKEIIGLLKDLPKIYDGLASDSKELGPYVSMYSNFITKVHKSDASSVLPDLTFLMDKGNVTTYQWVYGEPPLSVVAPTDLEDLVCPDDEDDQVSGGGIDFDLGDVIEGCIDLDLDTGGAEEGGTSGGGEIDWGEIVLDEDEGAAPDDIDWDIVDVAGDDGGVVITLEESGNEGGTARDSEALSILDNRKTRNLILDELHELQAFFIQRKSEISESGGPGLALVSGGDADINEKDMDEAIQKTSAIIATLSTGKLHHLQLVRGSAKYVDRLVGDLRQKLRLIERTRLQNDELRARREQCVTEECQLRETLKGLMEKTRVLQANVIKDISVRYDGRKVNIMGGVQTL